MFGLRKSLFALTMLLIPMTVGAAGLPTGEKVTISIGEVKVLPSVMELAEDQGKLIELKRISESLGTQLISSISATRTFHLVERAASKEPEETKDSVDSEAAEVTKKTPGARYLIIPRIDGFDDTTVVLKQKATGRSSVSRRLFLSALVQIADTTTGRLLPDIASIQITKSDDVNTEQSGKRTYSDRMVVELAREMAQQLISEAVGMVKPARILSVTGKQILINRGTDAGFEKGDLIEIYAAREEKDVDTGETFLDETPVGQALIVRLDGKQSFATVSGEDLGIMKGAVVRKLKSAASRRVEAEKQPPDPTIPDFDAVDTSDPNQGSGEKPLKWK
jgi:hypothetical protein